MNKTYALLWPLLGAWFSFIVNKSVFWAVVHACLGGVYVVYAALVYTYELDVYFSALLGL